MHPIVNHKQTIRHRDIRLGQFLKQLTISLRTQGHVPFRNTELFKREGVQPPKIFPIIYLNGLIIRMVVFPIDVICFDLFDFPFYLI